jgi:hypothetical protein
MPAITYNGCMASSLSPQPVEEYDQPPGSGEEQDGQQDEHKIQHRSHLQAAGGLGGYYPRPSAFEPNHIAGGIQGV